MKDDDAKSDAKHLAHAIKGADKKSLVEDDEVIRILSTRSKPHLKEVYEQYKKISHDKTLDEVTHNIKHNLLINNISGQQIFFYNMILILK